MPSLRSLLAAATAITGAGGLSACNNLLDVQLPTRIVAETLDDPQLAAMRVNSANADAGYAYTLLGEGFCEAAVDLGPILKPPAVLAMADQRFTTALQQAQTAGAAYADILNLALV